jgi:23S rRNA pseudouridine2605 synthase
MALTGIESPYGLLKALSVEKIGTGGAKTKLRVQIDEGKNRHIRRLFGAMKDAKFGTPLKVQSLSRVSIGSLQLDIESGKWRYLTVDEERVLLEGLR